MRQLRGCGSGDRLLDLGTPHQRTVLAALLLESPHPVSVSRLMAAVWGTSRPEPLPKTCRATSTLAELPEVQIQTGGGSTGWGCRALAQTSDALAEVDKLIKTLLVAAQVLHMDETSTQVARRRVWLHVACTPLPGWWRAASHTFPLTDGVGSLERALLADQPVTSLWSIAGLVPLVVVLLAYLATDPLVWVRRAARPGPRHPRPVLT